MAALAGRLGVRYAGELTCGASTHLVCRDLVGAVNTPKYLMALEWGVQVRPLAAPWLVHAPLPRFDSSSREARSHRPPASVHAASCMHGRGFEARDRGHLRWWAHAACGSGRLPRQAARTLARARPGPGSSLGAH